MKQGIGIYVHDVLAITYSMVIYLTIQHQGQCGHFEGHAYSVLFLPKYGLMTGEISTCIYTSSCNADIKHSCEWIADSLLLTTKQGVN